MIDMSAAGEDLDARIDEQFFDLMCTVEALVDAEFEELVSTVGTEPPVLDADLGRRPCASGHVSVRSFVAADRLRPPGGDVGESERSPPSLHGRHPGGVTA